MDMAKIKALASLCSQVMDQAVELGRVEDNYVLDAREADSPQYATQLDSLLGECDEQLILRTGRPDFDAHREMKKYGFVVKCGERDSFGWLTGVVVRTSDGVSLVYG